MYLFESRSLSALVSYILLLRGVIRVAQDGKVRPRPGQQRRGGPERGGAGEGQRGQEAVGAGPGGAPAGGRRLLPLQPPPHLGSEPQ